MQPPEVDFDEYSDDYRDAVEEVDLLRSRRPRLLHARENRGAARARPPPRRRGDARILPRRRLRRPVETDRLLKGVGREGTVGRLAGVDGLPGMVEHARPRDPGPSTAASPGESLPFARPSDLFHLVLHHVPRSERPALIDGMKRALRPGGLLFVFEHNPYNPLTRHAVAEENVDVTRRAVPLFVGLGAIEPNLIRLTSATRLVAAGAGRCRAHRGLRQLAARDASVIVTQMVRGAIGSSTSATLVWAQVARPASSASDHVGDPRTFDSPTSNETSAATNKTSTVPTRNLLHAPAKRVEGARRAERTARSAGAGSG